VTQNQNLDKIIF